MVANVIKNGIM